MMYDRYGMFGGWNFIILIIIICLIIFALNKLLSTNNNQTNNSDALNELNKKFVRGEISEDEYLQKKQIIKRD